MSMVLPPPGGPVLNINNTFPRCQSPGTMGRMAVQQQLLDNLTAELDRQASSQRRPYRLPGDARPDDMDWILNEKLRLSRNLRKKAASPVATAKPGSVATEFRSRYAIELLRQSHNHKTSADRRVIQARYSNPRLYSSNTMPTRHRTSPFAASTTAPTPFGTVPTGGPAAQGNTWDKVIRPAGPCISRLKHGPSATSTSYDSDVNMSRTASNRSATHVPMNMSRSVSKTHDADVSHVDNCIDAADDESEVPHYVQDLIDDDLDYDEYGNSSDVASDSDLMEVDQEADHDVPGPTPYEFTFSCPKPTGPTSTTTQESTLALYRSTIPVTESHVRAMCYWFAIHVVGRLAFPEPVRPGVNGSSAEEWDIGGVIDRSAKRMSGAGNFEPEWIASPPPPTPVRPHRVYGKIPSDPYQVLGDHGGPGPIIKPDPNFVNFLVHLIYEKEISIETIIAAAWFIDGLSVHEIDGEFGRNLRQGLTFSNPGESFAIERRLVMISLYLADMSVSDNYWALSAWADSCMVPRPQSRLMEREALRSLRHSITIPPKAWLDHCSHVYSNVARLRIGDATINWALLEICHKMVTTARGIVDANAQADYEWSVNRRNLELTPGFDLVRSLPVDTSRMGWESTETAASSNDQTQVGDSDQENFTPEDDDDDEYEEFDGAGSFPQPVFETESPAPFHQSVKPPAKVEVVESDFSAPALEAALSLVAMNQAPDNDSDPSAPVFDDDDDEESDYEPYDGAGHFPMPAIQGKRVVSSNRAATTAHNNTTNTLLHPRAVPRSPVQLARVRPVLNRFETMAAVLADAPYRFPIPQTVNQQTVLAALNENNVSAGGQSSSSPSTTQVRFYPATIAPGQSLSPSIPQYPAQPVADKLAVPPNPVWPPTNPLNMTLAAQPHATRPPVGRLSPVAARPGDVFPPVPIPPRENSLFCRRYRHPGFFRERYVPPPTPANQAFDPFAAPAFVPPTKGDSNAWDPSEKPLPSPVPKNTSSPHYLEPPPLSTNPLLSPSSDCGACTPNTPHEHVQIWRDKVAALGTERPPSTQTCVSTSTCDQNAWYWRFRDAMDDALAEDREFEGFLVPPPARRWMPELEPGTVINLGA